MRISQAVRQDRWSTGQVSDCIAQVLPNLENQFGAVDSSWKVILQLRTQRQSGRSADSRGDDGFSDDDDFLRPDAAAPDVFETEDMGGEAGEGRAAKAAAAKDLVRLAVELCLPDNAALEREAVRQRVAKLQDTLMVSDYYGSSKDSSLKVPRQ